jgi:hypothetical protein
VLVTVDGGERSPQNFSPRDSQMGWRKAVVGHGNPTRYIQVHRKGKLNSNWFSFPDISWDGDVRHLTYPLPAGLTIALTMVSYGFLPGLSRHREAASFQFSVKPFYDSARKHLAEYGSLLEAYRTINPVVSGSLFSFVISISIFVISSSTGNWSW